MTDKEKILAEIERRWKYDQGFATEEETKTYQQCCDDILSFINSLSKEHVSENLDKAAEEYAYTNWQSDDYHEGAAEGLPFDAIGHTEKCFKDGAMWQKEQYNRKAMEE